MATSKIITIATSIIVSASISSCSDRVNRATTYEYKTAETTAVADNTISTAGYTWTALSSGDCGYALLADNIISSSARGKSAIFPVIIEEANECHGMYRLINPMRAFGMEGEHDYNIVIDATNPTRVVIKRQDIGVDLGKGTVALESAASSYLEAGIPAIVVEDAGLFGTYENGEIHFADNSFFIWNNGTREDSNAAGSLLIILPERVAAYESTGSNIDYALGTEYLNRTRNSPALHSDSPDRLGNGAVAMN
ncbi:MAG: hypothetical protein K2J65_04645 [Duncaniella sp.]|nr:hypothetical protein [Duncaniella sp.]